MYVSMHQITICNVKGITRRDKPTQNYQLTLHFSLLCKSSTEHFSVFRVFFLVLLPSTVLVQSNRSQ